MKNALHILVDLDYAGGGCGVKVCYSDCTKQYYISFSGEIKDGILLTCPNCHGDTIEESARGILEKIKGKLLVFNADDEKRRKEIYFYGGEEQ